MKGYIEVGSCPEWMIFRQRFFFENVQYGRCEPALIQGVDQSRLIHCIASPDVNKDRVKRQTAQNGLIHNLVGILCSRQNTDEIIQSIHKLQQTVAVEILIYLCTFFTFPGKASNCHSKMFGSACQMGSDRADPKQANGLAAQYTRFRSLPLFGLLGPQTVKHFLFKKKKIP